MQPRIAGRSLRHVFIRNMVLAASIGVYAHEKTAVQRIRINIDLGVPEPPRAGVGPDELKRVVSYERIANSIRQIVAAGHVMLVETLAERIAEACLKDARVQMVCVRVEKLDVFADATSAGVEIERWAASCPPGAIDSQ